LKADSGIFLLNRDYYRTLIKAVEEHVDRVHDGAAKSLGAERPAYQQLVKLSAEMHKDRGFLDEFDAWTQRTHSVADAFDKLDPLYVDRNLVKSWQPTGHHGAASNAAMATSHAGAYVVAEWGKEMVVQTGVRVATEEGKRQYYLDTRENRNTYKAMTLN